MTEETTARHALPLLSAGQAQKELAHNEAVTGLDLLAHAAVEAAGVDAPPIAPAPGQCWIVGESPSAAWAGRAGALAVWTAGGWRFAAPIDGMRAWVKDAGLWAERVEGAWSLGVARCAELRVGGLKVLGEQQAAIPDPGGGAVVDAEARAALALALGALRAHGLIAA